MTKAADVHQKMNNADRSREQLPSAQTRVAFRIVPGKLSMPLFMQSFQALTAQAKQEKSAARQKAGQRLPSLRQAARTIPVSPDDGDQKR